MDRFRWNGDGVAWALYAAGMAILAIVLFGDLRDREVVNYDDLHYLLQSERTSGDFRALLSPEYHGPRPVTDLAFWLGFELWGKEPKGYYAVSICVHTLASILLAILCYRMGSSRDIAFVAGALFLSTVAHFRNLFVIAGLAYPLALLFTILAVISFAIARQPGQSRWYAALSGAGLLAVLSHAAAIALFPLCIFIGYNRRDSIRATLLRVSSSGIGAAAALFCLVYFYPHKIQSYHSVHMPDMARISEHLLWLLGRLLATAHWLLVPVYGYQPWELGLGGLGLAAIVFLLFQRGATVAEWAFWVLITLLPFVNRLPSSFMRGDSGPSHYLYLASAGLAVLSAMLLRQIAVVICRRGRQRIARQLFYALSAGIVAYSATVIDELEIFSFYRSGEFQLRQRNADNAVDQLRLAVERLESDKVIDGERAYVALCYALLLKGERIEPTIDEARQKYPDSYRLGALVGAVSSIDPDSTVRQRGFESIRQAQEAADDRNRGEQLNAQLAETYECLADALNGARDFRRARQAAQHSLAYRQSARTYFALGTAHTFLGEYERAAVALENGILLDPGIAELQHNLGHAYRLIGEFGKAENALQRATELKPGGAVSHYELGLARSKLDDHEGAAEAYMEAVRLDPANDWARFELAMSFVQLGDPGAARAEYDSLRRRAGGQVGELRLAALERAIAAK